MEDLRADTDRNTEYTTEFLKAKCPDFTYIKLLLIIKSAIALASNLMKFDVSKVKDVDLIKRRFNEICLNDNSLIPFTVIDSEYNIYLIGYKHYE